MQLQLILKALFFTALFPGTITVLVPYLILNSAGLSELPELTFLKVLVIVFGFTGAVILLYCIWGFAFYGKGTLSTVDPPKVLVVRGFYKYTRNPMYFAVLCILIFEAIFFSSTNIFIYAAVIFLMFHFFVILYEEPHLTREFGERYKRYLSAIPRWGISLNPFSENNPANQ